MDQKDLWNRYWSELTEFYLYKLRVSLIFKNINLTNLKTLEVGCGPATDSLLLAQKGAKTTCLDFSENAIQLAITTYKKFNTHGEFILGDGLNLCFKDESFDIVFNAGVIEHFKDPSRILEEMIRVSKNWLMVWVPQKYNPYTLKKHAEMKRGTWAPGWETEYSYYELKRLLEKFNQEVVDSLGSAPNFKVSTADYFLKKYIGRLIGREVGILSKKY